MQPVPLQVVTIETIDQAISDWLDKTVDASVEHPNGQRRKVPVLMSSGERFATGRTRKGIRDKNGVLVLPIISFRRTSVSPDPSMQGLGTETATLTVSRRITPKTNNLMNLQAARKDDQRFVPDKPVVYEVTSIPFPDRSIMNYELTVQAQYMTQANSIVEKLLNSLDLQKSFLAPFDNPGRNPPAGEEFELRKPLNSGFVVGFITGDLSDAGNFEEFTDQERIVQWTVGLQVPATLQLDPEGTRPMAQHSYTAFGLSFGPEESHFVDEDELDKVFS